MTAKQAKVSLTGAVWPQDYIFVSNDLNFRPPQIVMVKHVSSYGTKQSAFIVNGLLDNSIKGKVEMHRQALENLLVEVDDIVSIEGGRSVNPAEHEVTEVVLSLVDRQLSRNKTLLVSQFLEPWRDEGVANVIAQGRVSVVAIDNIFEVPYKDDRQKTIRVYISKLVFAKKEKKEWFGVVVSGKTKFSFESGGASIGGLERARMSSVGGFEKEKQQLKSVLIDPLKEDEDTTQELDLSNIRNTAVTDFNFKGILIVGPSGIGKTFIARAAINESKAKLILVDKSTHFPSPQALFSGRPLQTLESLVEIAKIQVDSNGTPSVLFIDNIDSLFPKGDQPIDQRDAEGQLMKAFDLISNEPFVKIVGTAAQTTSFPPRLLASGRFGCQIEMALPSQEDRKKIFMSMTKSLKSEIGEDMADLVAQEAQGRLPGDLWSIVTKSVNDAKDRQGEFNIRGDYLLQAVKQTNASQLMGTLVSVPDTTFEDIGGLDEEIKTLSEIVNNHVTHDKLFSINKVDNVPAVLMTGPPGCGKTLIAKAIANDCKANFLAIQGPALVSKWMGESAQQLRGIFARARSASPCVLFFDEIDALAAKRGGGTDGGSAASQENNRMTATLLTELDGVAQTSGKVFVIATSNLPENLDDALKNRFAKHIEIAFPATPEKRSQILAANMRRKPGFTGVYQKLAESLASEDKTGGFNGRELGQMVSEAVTTRINEHIDESGRHPELKVLEVSEEHLQKAADSIRKKAASKPPMNQAKTPAQR